MIEMEFGGMDSVCDNCTIACKDCPQKFQMQECIVCGETCKSNTSFGGFCPPCKRERLAIFRKPKGRYIL